MGCNRDGALCHDCCLSDHQRPSSKANHAQSLKVRSNRNRHRSVLPPASIRADHHRHPDKRQHLPQELDVLHPSEIPDRNLHYPVSNCQQETVQLGVNSPKDCRYQDSQETKKQVRSHPNASSLLLQLREHHPKHLQSQPEQTHLQPH